MIGREQLKMMKKDALYQYGTGALVGHRRHSIDELEDGRIGGAAWCTEGEEGIFIMTATKGVETSLYQPPEDAECNCYAAYGLPYGPGVSWHSKQYDLRIAWILKGVLKCII